MKKFKNLSIRSKLLISYLGIFTILSLAGFTTLYIITRAYITSHIEENLQASTESIHNTVKTTANQSIKAHLQSVAAKGYGIADKMHNRNSRGNLAEDLLNVNADSGQISQVLLNLCVNARQAMPEGGTLNVSAVNIPSSKKTGGIMQKDEQYIEIIISDTGPGIPPDYMKHIFDPYFSTKPDGKGLGLAICHSIIRQHNGWISVENNPGGGASFKLILPGVNTPVPESEDIKKNDKLLSGRILIMDDDPFIIKTASSMLQKLGFDTDSAYHGKEAIEKYRTALNSSEPFSAVIMDLTIPGGMGGKEAASKLIKIDPDAVIIVSSGYSNDAAMSRFREFGFTGALLKPYRVDDLKDVLYKTIG